jgi:hypothetical protein|tara:strand:- start:2501 stop:2983 length:483 start_codon:yes stop_codon:yes gene_type:complete
MRKITKESSEAFVNFDQYKKSNTEVAIKYGYSSSDEIARFYLHGNCIAEINRSKLPECRGLKSIEIDLCGWHTPTTRERINGILDALHYDFKIAQRNHEQVLVRMKNENQHCYVTDSDFSYSWEQELKLSNDSFDPEFAKKVFESSEFVSGTDLNAITDF